MIDTELKFKSKLEKAELLRRLAEWNISYIPEVLDDEYLWEPTENFDYLTYFPEHLSYPVAGTPENYYLRYYWIMICSKRFERKHGENLWQLESKVLDEIDRQEFEMDEELIMQLHKEAINRVATEDII